MQCKGFVRFGRPEHPQKMIDFTFMIFHCTSICTDTHKYVTGQIGLNLDPVLELEKTLSGQFGVLYFIFTSLRFFSQIWMQLQRAPDDTLWCWDVDWRGLFPPSEKDQSALRFKIKMALASKSSCTLWTKDWEGATATTHSVNSWKFSRETAAFCLLCVVWHSCMLLQRHFCKIGKIQCGSHDNR